MSQVAPTALEAMLPYRILLNSALEYSGGTHDFEDVVAEVATGAMQFWPARLSCVVTQIVCYPKMRALHIFLAAGDLEEIKNMDETFREFGKQLDCKHITLSGRKGWIRALADIGYTPVHTTMAKEISE